LLFCGRKIVTWKRNSKRGEVIYSHGIYETLPWHKCSSQAGCIWYHREKRIENDGYRNSGYQTRLEKSLHSTALKLGTVIRLICVFLEYDSGLGESPDDPSPFTSAASCRCEWQKLAMCGLDP
jgi:hypothetical protein